MRQSDDGSSDFGYIVGEGASEASPVPDTDPDLEEESSHAHEDIDTDLISFASSQKPTPADDYGISFVTHAVSNESSHSIAATSNSTPLQQNTTSRGVTFGGTGFEVSSKGHSGSASASSSSSSHSSRGNPKEEEKREVTRLDAVDEEDADLNMTLARMEDGFDDEDEVEEGQKSRDIGEKKYDLGAYDLSRAPSGSRDDDETSGTQLRSGATEGVLHTFMKRKDWAAVREFFRHPPKEREKLLAAIYYSHHDGETPLHIAARKNAPLDIVKKITHEGGKRTVLACNTYGNSTPLHHACHFNASPRVVEHLINVGGCQAARMIDDIWNLPLHWALSKRLPNKNVKHLIDVGGFDTAMIPNRIGWTALHTASYFDANAEQISYLVGICGPDTVRTLDKKNRTPLCLILERNSFCVESILIFLHALGDLDSISLNLPQNAINNILEWVRKQPDSAALESVFVQRILNETFTSRKYLTIWMIDLYMQLLLVLFFSFGIDNALRNTGVTINTTPTVFFYISICWFLGREFIQFITTPFNEFAIDAKNWLDVTQIVLVFMCLDILVFKGGVKSEYEESIVTVTAGIVWINLLSVLGKAFYRIRLFIVYVQMLLFRLMPFFIGSFCIIAAFAQMFYISNNYDLGACTAPMIYTQDQDWLCTLTDTYFMTFYSVITNQWKFMEQPSTSPLTALSFSLALITVLLLFTSLIGQIVSLNEEIEQLGVVSFWSNRLSTIIEISDFNETFGCGCCKKDIADRPKKHFSVESRGDTQIPMHRFTFSKAEKYKIFPEDDDMIREWWLGTGERVPPVSTRMRYFFKWAPIREIAVPGRELERALGGHSKDHESYWVRLGTYVVCPMILLLILIVFLLGVGTFGLLWPRDMREIIFAGPENLARKHRDARIIERIDAVKRGIESIQAERISDSLSRASLEKDMKLAHYQLHEILRRLADDGSTTDNDTECITTKLQNLFS